MKCPYCHVGNEDSAHFCRNCGKPLSNSNTSRNKSSKTILFSVMFIVSLVVVLVAIIYNNRDSYNPTILSEDSSVQIDESLELFSDAETVMVEEVTVTEDELTLEELYSVAETVNDLRHLADQGYLPAAFDLVSILYQDERYDECSKYAYKCIDANYRIDEVWEILSELPACYWRREYSE